MTSQQDKTKKTWLLKLSSEKSHKIPFKLFKLETRCLRYLRATISQNNLNFIVWKSLSIEAFVENLTVLAQLSLKILTSQAVGVRYYLGCQNGLVSLICFFLLVINGDLLKLRICCLIKIGLRKWNFFGVKEFFFREFWFQKWM